MTENDLFEFFAAINKPLTQDEHFEANNLKELFSSKIAKSQATGKDGVRVGRFEGKLAEEVALIGKRFSSHSYRFTTYKERLILRGAERQPRQISIPTVRDRLALRALCQVLHFFVPQTRSISPHALVKKVVDSIRAGDQASKVFVRIDVKDFFPSVAHPILARELRSFGLSDNVRELCMAAVKTATGSSKEPNGRGVPQGLSVSGALAALYMLKFDASQVKQAHPYFRYVDDILFICEKNEADDLLKSVSRKLKARGLHVHAKGVAGKTEISPVLDGVDFLGYRINIDKVSIRKSSYQRMFKNLLKVITNYQYRRDFEKLLFKLNLKITGCIVDGGRRGWMMFFSYTENVSQLAFLDKFLSEQLARVGAPKAQIHRVKKFVKSYHEIRYNLNNTSYVPNFDKYGAVEKAKIISTMSSYTELEISSWDIEAIDREFSRIISYEVQDLERDVGNIS